GDFLLRIEDTDQHRYVPGAEDYIIESLKWCGIKVDEGVTVGGEHAPYRQSERKPIYKKYAEELVAKGFAYYAFDTAEELEALRKELEAAKAKNTSYSAQVRMKMKNSLTLSKEDVEKKLAGNEPYVIRFKMPENEELKVHDIIREWVTVNTSTLDDKVLFKSDGMPTYHLANVVDDYLMKISHVIRGEEWLPSLPLHVMLYRAFGWEKDMPEFAHLPLLLKPDGKGKLSKRDGDRLGFPVFPLQWVDPKSGEISSGYRESGYFPQAFVNMLALLGWNPGTEQEVFSMKELEDIFSIEKVHKAGSRFDLEKAKWFNQQYLRMQDDEELARLFVPVLEEKGIQSPFDYVMKVCHVIKERVNFVKELWDNGYFFFQVPQNYDPATIKKRWKADSPSDLTELGKRLSTIADFNHEEIEKTVHLFLEEKQLGMGVVMNALRLALVGKGIGPDMVTMMVLLGKEEVLARIETAVSLIK
ncbi:MAG: glutamate--tRNA ligase, partial [Bacteroidota bacterium]|nr:glutamate--tRNA ligase [Bacteroidota bacterium]